MGEIGDGADEGWRKPTDTTAVDGNIPRTTTKTTIVNGDNNGLTTKHHNKNAHPPSSSDLPSFENVLEELGSFGKFQMRQLTIGFLGSFITAYMTMSFVFLGYEPFHICAPLNTTIPHHHHDFANTSSSSSSAATTTTKVTYQACIIKISAVADHYGNITGLEDISVSDSAEEIDCPRGRIFPNAEHTTFISEWDLVCESMGQAEVSHLVFTIGQLTGGLIVSAIADLLGRKPVLTITSFFAFLAEFCTVFAPNIYFVYVIRFFSGLFVQGLSCCFFVHGMEWLIPKHRQIYGVAICIFWVFQLLLVGGAAYLLQDYSWKFFQGAGAISGVMFFVYPLFLYESPRWLAVRYRFTDSLLVLKVASDVNGKNYAKVEEVFNSYADHYRKSSEERLLPLRTEDEKNENDSDEYDASISDRASSNYNFRSQASRKNSLLRLFSQRKVIVMTLTAWYLWITHNMTYYGLYMTSSELVGNRFLNYSLMVLVEIPSNLLILYVMSKISRRLVLRLFLGMAAACLLASTVLVSAGNSSGSHNVLSSVLFVAGKFAISASFNVLYIITPEIFPTSLRVSGAGSCTSVDKIGSMVAPFLRPLTSLAAWGPGVVFTSMCAFALLLTPLLPETKDINLPSTLQDRHRVSIDSVESEEKDDDDVLELSELSRNLVST